jgi:TolB-like protein
LFAPSGDFTDYNGLRKFVLRSTEEMPGPATTVASSDDAFDDERGVAKARQCVIEVRRATREGKTVEWGECAPALTGRPQQIEQLELHEPERSITSLQQEQRSVIHFVGPMRANYDQIASACDLAIGTIRSWLARGRKALCKLTGVASRQHPRASWRRRLVAPATIRLGRRPPTDCRSNIAKDVTRQTRRLAAILAADVAGYSRLMGADEEGTLAALKQLRSKLADPKIEEHHGRIVKTTGDGLLVEFPSVVDAVRCAVEVQCEMAECNIGVPVEKRIEFRIGINVGDIIIDDDDIFGDGVNVAARLEALAEPGGICVSRAVHDQVRDKVDIAFEDRGKQQVKNILRPVHFYRIPISENAPTKAPLPLPDNPSIAVLPFANMSGDPEQEYFADGMVEEIITALCRIRWLFVIARNSSFTYKGQAIDVKQVGQELGVRYLLEGSVRKTGQRVRITAQLIEAATGAHLWADHFDGLFEEVFELQDQVASSVAGVIEPTLQASEVRRSSARQTRDLTAYDFYLRALAKFPWMRKEQLLEALDLFGWAIARDPRYGAALAWAAICHHRLCEDGWVEDPEVSRRKALGLAEEALALADGDPVVLANAAYVLGTWGEGINTAMALVDRCVSLNPSYARGWYVSGMLRVRAGQYDAAIEQLAMSLRLDPRGYLAIPRFHLGLAHFFSRRFDQAAELLALSTHEFAGLPHAYRALAACYAHMGRLVEARAVVERLRVVTPNVIPSFLPYPNRDQRELFLSGLRLAMGEQT